MDALPKLTFSEAFRLFFITNYTNFKGRSRRSEYWWANLLMYIVQMVLSIVVILCFWSVIAGFIAAFQSHTRALPLVGGGLVIGIFAAIILVVVELLVLLPSIAGSVRRLHDIGQTGWLVAIPMGAQLVSNFLISFAQSLNKSEQAIQVITIICGVLYLAAEGFMIYLYCKDSEKGFNKWGDSPKYPSTQPPMPNARQVDQYYHNVGMQQNGN